MYHPYHRFIFMNKVNQFRVLTFGLSTATQVFIGIDYTVPGYLHRDGISVLPYLDNWLVRQLDQNLLVSSAIGPEFTSQPPVCSAENAQLVGF